MNGNNSTLEQFGIASEEVTPLTAVYALLLELAEQAEDSSMSEASEQQTEDHVESSSNDDEKIEQDHDDCRPSAG